MKSLKILAPLAVLSCSLTSCNGGAGVHTRFNRDNYKALDSQTAEAASTVLSKIESQQIREPNEDESTVHAKLFNAGTIDSSIDLGVTGKVLYSDLDVHNVNLGVNLRSSISWNAEKGFLRSVGNNPNHSYYIVYDKDGDKYWYAYSRNIDGVIVKVRDDITQRVTKKDDGFLGYIGSRIDNSYDLHFGGKSVGFYVDLGISGFGHTFDKSVHQDKISSIADMFREKDMISAYDYLKATLKDGYNLDYKLASDSDTTFLGDVAGHLPFAPFFELVGDDLVNYLEELKKSEIIWLLLEMLDLEYLPDYLISIINDTAVSGDAYFDVYASWKDNYIHQQEIMLNGNLKSSGVADLGHDEEDRPAVFDTDLKLDVYYGQEVKQTADDIDIKAVLNEYAPSNTK